MHRPNLPFWKRLENLIEALERINIQVDLILFHPYDRWGFSQMSAQEDLDYLSLVIRRLFAYPNIWWSLANEYDLVVGKRLTDWERLARFLHENDPYGHLLSCHNCMAFYDHGRAEISHASVQSSLVHWVEPYRKRYRKPIIFDEMRYEGNLPFEWGNISAFELVHRFWMVYCSGGYASHGETFLNNLWWAKGGVLTGKSPKRIAFLRTIVEGLPAPIDPVPKRGNFASISDAALETIRETMPMIYAMAHSAKRMDAVELALAEVQNAVAEGTCGQDAFLHYYGRNCPAQATVDLPKDGTFRVRVIDIWDMTEQIFSESASGTFTLSLPEKEGIAVIAERKREV